MRGHGLPKRAAFLFPLALALLVPALSAGEGRGYLELSGGFATGDFGTETRSDLYYFGPTLGYIADSYDVSVFVPYLHLRVTSAGQDSTESGIGDVILRGGMVAVREGESGFSVDGAVAVKVPTASETDGLGTGEADYGGFLNLRQRMGSFKGHLSFGYIIVGEPAFQDYNNISLFGLGLSRVFGSTDAYAAYEMRTSSLPGGEDPQEISLGAFHVLNSEYSLKGSLFLGLNDGGPEFGYNLGVVRWF